MPTNPETSRHLQILADSPLFWVFVFAAFALAAALAIAPKYERRQAQEERKFQARSFAAGRTAGGETPPDGRQSVIGQRSSPRKYIDRDTIIHRLWPIYGLLIALIEVSRARLLWRLDTMELGGANESSKVPT